CGRRRLRRSRPFGATTKAREKAGSRDRLSSQSCSASGPPVSKATAACAKSCPRCTQGSASWRWIAALTATVTVPTRMRTMASQNDRKMRQKRECMGFAASESGDRVYRPRKLTLQFLARASARSAIGLLGKGQAATLTSRSLGRQSFHRQCVPRAPHALHGDPVRQLPELTPQIADVGIEAAVGRQEPAAERLQHQVLAAHRAGVGPHEKLEDPELGRRELEVLAVDLAPPGAQIE